MEIIYLLPSIVGIVSLFICYRLKLIYFRNHQDFIEKGKEIKFDFNFNEALLATLAFVFVTTLFIVLIYEPNEEVVAEHNMEIQELEHTISDQKKEIDLLNTQQDNLLNSLKNGQKNN